MILHYIKKFYSCVEGAKGANILIFFKTASVTNACLMR